MIAYIASYGVISPQLTFDAKGFPQNIITAVTNRMSCQEPDYRQHINPIQLRRMPRILKMGLASASICLDGAGADPDAIVVGTGLGCLESLEKFLLEVLEKNEQVTSVLPFINSTHNAVASQIAMMLKNNGYNFTYCHRAMSFESALQDALMLLEEGHANHVLAGGIDECTDHFMQLHDYLGKWKKPQINLDLFKEKTPGTLAGEGSAFFLLSDAPVGDRPVCLRSVRTFFTSLDSSGNNDGKIGEQTTGNPVENMDGKTDGNPVGNPAGTLAGQISIEDELDAFLSSNGMGKDEVDLVLMGISGDQQNDSVYHQMMRSYFDANSSFAAFKHLCGEYYTASAFALWLGTVILREQQVPALVRTGGCERNDINNILIYNHYRNTEHAFMLLSFVP